MLLKAASSGGETTGSGGLDPVVALLYADLKLSSEQYGLGSGLFYAGYGVFMIPSTFMTMRYGARWWFGFITVCW